MFYEKTDEFIQDILLKTESQKLFWQPLSDFVDNCKNDKIIALFTDKDYKFFAEDCFYAQKHDSYLFVVHSEHKSMPKNNDNDNYQLFGVINIGASPFTIPDYHEQGNEGRIKRICQLAKKQYEYVFSEDALPEPIYWFYRNFMSED